MVFSAETKGALGAETNSALTVHYIPSSKKDGSLGHWVTGSLAFDSGLSPNLFSKSGKSSGMTSAAQRSRFVVSSVSEVSESSQSPTQVGGTNLYAAGNIRWILAIFLSNHDVSHETGYIAMKP